MKRVIEVGDTIEFDFFGVRKQGVVVTVGKFGLWIADNVGVVGRGCIRADFNKCKLVERRGHG